MSTHFLNEARRLAFRPYDEVISRDKTTRGDSIYLLENPELPGCMAQGRTIEEARQNLKDARVDYIASLLRDSLSVPQPTPTATITSGAGGFQYVYEASPQEESRFLPDLDRTIQPAERVRLSQVSFQT